MINCIAIDDEQLSLDLIEDNVSRVPFLKLLRKCTSVFDAMQFIANNNVDLIFLDIEMPDMNGLQMLRSLKTKPMVILITAYDKYAMQGYELDVVDYLLKPVSYDRFLKAVNKAYEYHAHCSSSPNEIISKTCLFVKSEHKILKINFDDILYIESLKDYVKIYCGQKPVLTLMSLKALENALPTAKFIRIHRSIIVAVDKISFISRSKVYIGDVGLAVSSSYKDNIAGLISE
ncbi:MAG: LytTR family DNA-binding domain-containing protein [Bacteroidales bacterium]|nr:LytTR family DNA-binding domain-containing protein [Bacteroidales bacterium]